MSHRVVGAVRIDRLVETETTEFAREDFFPTVAAGDWERYRSWLQPWAWDPSSGRLLLCVQAFLLRTPTRTVLVDTCVGDHKKRWRKEWTMTTDSALLRRLDVLGVRPREVDVVVCTHMHADHVGWNTTLVGEQWRPTFENASYILSTQEWAAWRARHDVTPVDQVADSVLPIIDAGRAHLVDGDFEITSEIHLVPTGGHTPGHVSVEIRSMGARAVITGDVIQHPVQCREPEWSSSADWDPVAAKVTRRRMLQEWSASGTLVCASHFPSPSFGYISRSGARYDFVLDPGD